MFTLRHACSRAAVGRSLLAFPATARPAAACLAFGRSFAAPAPQKLSPRAPPPKKKIRSLAEIEADQRALKASSSRLQWTKTTEPGEEAQTIIFERPPHRPVWLYGFAAAALTSCFFFQGLTMMDLANVKVVDKTPSTLSEEAGRISDAALPSPAPSSSSPAMAAADIIQSRLPFKLPTVTSYWAIGFFALSMAPPTALMLFLHKSCARVVQYRPSGRMRVFSRLEDKIGKGTLIDFGIAQGVLSGGATTHKLQLIYLHLPPLGFDPSNSTVKLKFPTKSVDLRPLDANELARAGPDVKVSQTLIAQAFGGISFLSKQPVKK